MNLTAGNLFDPDETPSPQDERSRDLYASAGVRIARIESNAYSSPEGSWFDQDDDEWVAVIAGDAVIEFDDGTWHSMGTGDWVVIPAHTRHRIAGTDAKTIWLAVHVARGATPLAYPFTP